MAHHKHDEHERREERAFTVVIEELLVLIRETATFIRQSHEASQREIRELKEIVRLLKQSGSPAPKSLTVKIGGKMGNTVLSVGQKAQATAHEWSGLAGTGSELPLAGTIAWKSGDESVFSIDPSTGVITGVGPSKLDANGAPIPVDVTATDSVAKDPNGNPLSNPSGDATITDVPLAAKSMTVTVVPL